MRRSVKRQRRHWQFSVRRWMSMARARAVCPRRSRARRAIRTFSPCGRRNSRLSSHAIASRWAATVCRSNRRNLDQDPRCLSRYHSTSIAMNNNSNHIKKAGAVLRWGRETLPQIHLLASRFKSWRNFQAINMSPRYSYAKFPTYFSHTPNLATLSQTAAALLRFETLQCDDRPLFWIFGKSFQHCRHFRQTGVSRVERKYEKYVYAACKF